MNKFKIPSVARMQVCLNENICDMCDNKVRRADLQIWNVLR